MSNDERRLRMLKSITGKLKMDPTFTDTEKTFMRVALVDYLIDNMENGVEGASAADTYGLRKPIE